MRKDMDLEVMDRILISYQSSAKLNMALDTFSDFICKETLANRLQPHVTLNGTEWNLNGEACNIKVELNV